MDSVSGVDTSPWPGTVVKMHAGESGRTVFCVAGGGASAWSFVPLTSQLGPADAVVTLQARGVGRRAPAEWTVNGMVRRRIAKIRRLQPQGPYVIVGHSLGAVLTLEIARRLTGQGEEVTAFLIDPYFSHDGTPPWTLTRLLFGGPSPRGWLSRSTVRRGVEAVLVLCAGLVPNRLDRRFGLTTRQAGLASFWHRPRSCTARITAYRTEENGDPTDLWRSLLPQGTIRDLPCSHMSILQRPFVDVIAGDVREAQQANRPA